jgi:uncharacterized membrane protein (UPF0127 family)
MRRVALALLVVGAIGIGVSVFALIDSGADDATTSASNARLRFTTRPAVAPFPGATETRLALGGRCLRLVIADDEAERVQGLRRRDSLGAYDGMLFVYAQPSNATFTMSTVPVPLDIGFYRASGAPVSRRRMTPCPRVDAECPDYTADAPFVYAVETLRGQLPSGALTMCA